MVLRSIPDIVPTIEPVAAFNAFVLSLPNTYSPTSTPINNPKNPPNGGKSTNPKINPKNPKTTPFLDAPLYLAPITPAK